MKKNGDFLPIFCLNWQKTKTVIHTTPRKTIMYKMGHFRPRSWDFSNFCYIWNTIGGFEAFEVFLPSQDWAVLFAAKKFPALADILFSNKLYHRFVKLFMSGDWCNYYEEK